MDMPSPGVLCLLQAGQSPNMPKEHKNSVLLVLPGAVFIPGS